MKVDIPDAPGIPGLHFRTYEGEADVPAMARVMNEAARANESMEYYTDAELRNWLAHPTNVDPRRDLVLTFVGSELAAVSFLSWEDSNEGPRHYQTYGSVAPRWRGRGLGTALLPYQEGRLRAMAAGHELEQPPLLVTWVDETDRGATALVESRGFEQVRTYFHMVRPDMEDIELPPLAEGIEVRPVSRVELRRVWDAMSEAFKDHFGAMDPSEAAFGRWSNSPRMRPELLLAAFDGDEVAAAVQGVIVDEENEANGYLRGWTDPIFTRRRWRRRGLASAVLGRTLALLRDQGMTSAQLGVDTENPNDALRLYRRHRFEPVHTETEWHKPLEIVRA
jgi:ribosomal protein S18 acetylase RimI-like enzyme